MTKNITVKYRDDKRAKNGTPFLSVKDTDGKYYSVWAQELFHLFVAGARLEVSIITKGKFTNIEDVLQNGNATTGVASDRVEPQNGYAPQKNPQKEKEGSYFEVRESREDQILKGLREIYAQNTKILERLDGLEGVNN